MGWASGSELAQVVFDSIHMYIPREDAVGVYIKIIKAFEQHDCDTLDEVKGNNWWNKAMVATDHEVDEPILEEWQFNDIFATKTKGI